MDDKIQQIKALAELLKSNAITQSEFDSLKNELLNASSEKNIPESSMQSNAETVSLTNSGKIAFDNSEQNIMDGMAVHLGKGIFTTQGTAYLTTKRFIFCKRSFGMALGVFSLLTNAKNIVFVIELSNLKSINTVSHGLGTKTVFKTNNGEEFGIGFNFNKDKWISEIQSAVKAANPKAQIKVTGKLIEFI